VEDRNLFLRRLEEDGKWFRYYRLYADFLRHRLERELPQRLPALHRAAAHWFAEHDMLTDAVTHALAAGDAQWAAQRVEDAGVALLEQGQMARLLTLSEAVPADAAAARPRLQLVIALANLTLRKEAAARAALERIYRIADAPELEPTDAANLRAHCRLVEAVATVLADHTDGVEERIAPALADPDAFEPWYPAGAAVAAAFVALARSDYAAARACRERAAGYLASAKGPFTETYAYCLSGIAAHEQLDIDAAEYYFRKACQVAMRRRSTPGMAARLAGALLGDLLYEQDRLEEAEKLLDEAFEVTPTAGTADFMIAVFVTGAKIKAARHDHRQAEARLEAGMRLARELSLPRLAASITGERIRLGFEQDGIASTAVFGQAGLESLGTAELTGDILRANAVRHSLTASAAGPPLLEEAKVLVETLAQRGRERALITAKLLWARCLWVSGEHDMARRIATQIAARCGELGLPRLIADEEMRSILPGDHLPSPTVRP